MWTTELAGCGCVRLGDPPQATLPNRAGRPAQISAGRVDGEPQVLSMKYPDVALKLNAGCRSEQGNGSLVKW